MLQFGKISNKVWWVVGLILLIGSYFLAYHLGERHAIKDISNVRGDTTTKVRYLPLPSISDTIPNPVPIITYIDTGSIKYIPIEVRNDSGLNTAKVFEDYVATREYTNTLFDNDSLGKLVVNSSVNYNRLKSMNYQFNPITRVVEKEITNTVEIKKVIPFVGVGAMTNDLVHAQVGIFFKGKIGISGNAIYDWRNHKFSYGGTLLYKLE